MNSSAVSRGDFSLPQLVKDKQTNMIDSIKTIPLFATLRFETILPMILYYLPI
jgi:hypothetical protein